MRWSLPLASFVMLSGVLAACDKPKEQSQAAAPAPAVGVIPVASKEVQQGFEFVGRVVAIDKVELIARIQGFLEQRLFEEGAIVKAGDLLFTIEKAPFQAAVDEARASLSAAQAQLANAQIQYQRAAVLAKQQNIPQATMDTRKAEQDTAQGNTQQAQAALEAAQINLGYTDIRAPITGKIGQAAFTVGNVVGPNAGPLALIVSQDPIYVTFPVSTRQMLGAQKNGTHPGDLQVKLRLGDNTIYDQIGKIDFIDNKVDQSTDTVTVRASFPNPKGVLIDGQLANVVLQLAKPEEQLVVPQAAVLVDQVGSYVLVVDDANKVEQRRVRTGAQQGVEVAVLDGLKAGEKVILDGLQKVRPGQTVAASPTKSLGA